MEFANGIVITYIFWGLLFSGLMGAFIGGMRGRTIAGIIWSVLLGPVGWLIVLIGPDERKKCSECKGVVPEDARKCMHCGADLRSGAQIREDKAAANQEIKPKQKLASSMDIFEATEAGLYDRVKELIGKGATINRFDKEGRTPLDIAIASNHNELIELLKRHGGKTSEVKSPA